LRRMLVIQLDRHLDEGQIESYSMQMGDAQEAARFEEHLLICETCQERLMEMDSYIASMRQAAGMWPKAMRSAGF
jgi:hypothetical protein